MEKRKRTELIWLVCVVLFYFLYNAPFVPAYNDAKGMLFHALFTLLPLWIVVYVGFFVTCRLFPIRDAQKEAEENEEKKQDKVTKMAEKKEDK